MAELRQYWAFPFPTTIHILLCTSALLSIVTTALSLASKPIVSVMIVIFPSLTFLTLLHHGFVLVIARKKVGRRESPKIVSKTLVRKRHIYALCFLSFFWLTGTAWAVPIAVRSKSRVHVANEAIGLLELLVLLSVLVICIKERRRIWRERLDGKVNDIESNSNGIPMQSLNKSKADNVIEISDEENAKPEAEPEQRSDQEGGGSTQVPEADQSPTTEALHTVIEYT